MSTTRLAVIRGWPSSLLDREDLEDSHHITPRDPLPGNSAAHDGSTRWAILQSLMYMVVTRGPLWSPLYAHARTPHICHFDVTTLICTAPRLASPRPRGSGAASDKLGCSPYRAVAHATTGSEGAQVRASSTTPAPKSECWPINRYPQGLGVRGASAPRSLPDTGGG